MKRSLGLVIAGTFLMTWLMAAQATPQQTMLGEAAEHPRIAKAIVDLEDAIQYMEAAPHNFGGHKAAAIADCRRAVTQLKLALAFRTKSDNRRGR